MINLSGLTPIELVGVITALAARRDELLSAQFDREAERADRWYSGQIERARQWGQ